MITNFTGLAATGGAGLTGSAKVSRPMTAYNSSYGGGGA
jgi:hypothetical protein